MSKKKNSKVTKVEAAETSVVETSTLEMTVDGISEEGLTELNQTSPESEADTSSEDLANQSELDDALSDDSESLEDSLEDTSDEETDVTEGDEVVVVEPPVIPEVVEPPVVVESGLSARIVKALADVKQYTENMGPTVPADVKYIKTNQRNLFMAVHRILTCDEDDSKEAIGSLLDIYFENKDLCFQPRLAGRFIDETSTLTPSQRGFLNIITTLLVTISDRDTRHTNATGMDMGILKNFLPAEEGDLVVNRLNKVCNITR